MSRKRSAPVVAIDGPAGAGKSTVSRRVAEDLGYLLLDTGALYRCVALTAQRAGHTEPQEIAKIAISLGETQRIQFQTVQCQGEPSTQRVLLNGEDVSLEIRTPEISTLASRVSALPEVRAALLDLQRRFGEQGRVVVEGRDIGTVVFPDAEAKFFLTASVEARATRRFQELKERNGGVTVEEVQDDVVERDRRDSMRPVAPLAQAPDAILVDSTDLGIDEVVARMVDHVRQVERELAAGAIS